MQDVRFVDYFGKDISETVLAKLKEVYPDLLNLTGAIQLFPPAHGGGEGLAQWAKVPFLGRIPIFTSLQKAAENGEGVINQEGPASTVISKIVNSKCKDRGMISSNRILCESLDFFFFICLLEL